MLANQRLQLTGDAAMKNSVAVWNSASAGGRNRAELRLFLTNCTLGNRLSAGQN